MSGVKLKVTKALLDAKEWETVSLGHGDKIEIEKDAGRAAAVLHPDVISKHGWREGQILELASTNDVTHAKLVLGSLEKDSAREEHIASYKRKLAGHKYVRTDSIAIDECIRGRMGAKIGDKINVRVVEASEAEQITLTPLMNRISNRHKELQEYMITNYDGHVFTQKDWILPYVQVYEGDTDYTDKVIYVDAALMGSGREFFYVADTEPAGPVIVTEGTIFKIRNTNYLIPRIWYDDLGGLKNEVQKIRETVELPLKHPELFEQIGIEAPKGVLLYGPPGTGKTLIAKALAGETDSHFIGITGTEIMSKWYGDAEARLREIFKEAGEWSPSIIFIDEIDSIAPKREEIYGELEKRIVAQLLALMDGMEDRGKVVVIAATNRPNSIDPALRRPGRFDMEIEIGIPGEDGRLEILKIHTRRMPLDEKVDLGQMARVTHGFVGADIAALSKDAAMRALRRVLPEIDPDQDKIPDSVLQKIKVRHDDFREALKRIKPSALREVLVQIPDVSWNDVGGLEGVKEKLVEAVEWPLMHKEACEHVGVMAPKGILLYGPPGTGKTLIAKAVAKMTESNFISIKGPELLSKWVGESEKGVREIFRKARQVAPCIIFFDEIDALIPRRSGGSSSHVTENVVSQILTEIDGLEELHGVLIIGATNRLDIVDEAMLRPGRFDYVVEAPNPDAAAREQILKIHTRKKPLGDDVDVAKLASLTDGLSGADLAAVANRAARDVLRRHIASGSSSVEGIKITQHDLEGAIREIKRPVQHS